MARRNFILITIEASGYNYVVTAQVTKAYYESLYGAEIGSKIIGGFPPKIY